MVDPNFVYSFKYTFFKILFCIMYLFMTIVQTYQEEGSHGYKNCKKILKEVEEKLDVKWIELEKIKIISNVLFTIKDVKCLKI